MFTELLKLTSSKFLHIPSTHGYTIFRYARENNRGYNKFAKFISRLMFDRIDEWADRFSWLVWFDGRSVNGWLVSAWQNMFKFDTIYWLQMWNNDDYGSSQIESKWYMFVYLRLTDWLNSTELHPYGHLMWQVAFVYFMIFLN